jgi:hypothetical protein
VTIKDIRPALVEYLYDDPAIYAVVGGGATKDSGGRRIYPMLLQQGQKQPSIVYSTISGEGDHHMQGPSGLARPRIQIDAWAQTADAATSLANLIKSRIDGFQGEIAYGSSSPQSTVKVRGIFFAGDRDLYDDVAKMYRVSRDYFIWFAEF